MTPASVFKAPKPFTVFVTVAPTERNGVTTAFVARIGTCNTRDEARKLIRDDLNAMQDTLGGLIDAPGVGGRTYRVFHAEWTEVKV